MRKKKNETGLDWPNLPNWLPPELEQEFSYKQNGGKYTVKLSNVGNPDFRQDCTRPLPETFCAWAHVNTLREASEMCRKYIAFCDLGGGNWNGGEIVRVADGLVIGHVSYNGRVWEPGEYPTKEITKLDI